MFSIYIFQHFELSIWGQKGVLCVYTCVHVCVFVCMYVYVCTGVFQIQISPYPAQTHMADFSPDKSEHRALCLLYTWNSGRQYCPNKSIIIYYYYMMERRTDMRKLVDADYLLYVQRHINHSTNTISPTAFSVLPTHFNCISSCKHILCFIINV